MNSHAGDYPKWVEYFRYELSWVSATKEEQF